MSTNNQMEMSLAWLILILLTLVLLADKQPHITIPFSLVISCLCLMHFNSLTFFQLCRQLIFGRPPEIVNIQPQQSPNIHLPEELVDAVPREIRPILTGGLEVVNQAINLFSGMPGLQTLEHQQDIKLLQSHVDEVD